MRQVIDSIPQMSYTVRDLDRAIALFTEGLGVGPFLNVKFGHVEGDASFDDGAMPIEDYYLNGDYVGTYGIRMGAVTWDNGIQLELIEPMENRSLFRQYLDSHGPGPQHIAVSSPLTFQETLGAMAAAGNPLASMAKVDRAEDCAFVRHKPLGTDLEVQYRPPDYKLPEGEPPLVFPDREKRPRSPALPIDGYHLRRAGDRAGPGAAGGPLRHWPLDAQRSRLPRRDARRVREPESPPGAGGAAGGWG